MNGLSVLFVVFLVLKLAGVVAWSWVWVLAPLWMPFGIGICILAGAFLAALLA